MKHLLNEAKRLGIAIQTGDLPLTENARYFKSENRIILRTSITDAEAHRALAVALGYAYHCRQWSEPDIDTQAQMRSVTLLLQSLPAPQWSNPHPSSGVAPVSQLVPHRRVAERVTNIRSRLVASAAIFSTLSILLAGGSLQAVGS